jgi:GNAT superfamily N-acetyltransferase
MMTFRLLTAGDIPALDALTAGHIAESGYFAESLVEQDAGKRQVFLCFRDETLAGYAHLNFSPKYAPFRRLGIPEIQDVFVHPDFRRQGVGAGLVQVCEDATRQAEKTDIGIGVGVGSEFGAAQRLYARLGYIPDGAGVVFDREGVSGGDMRPVDDRLCLMLVKGL